ncbi:MAG: 3-oxo-tetronate kinase [Kiloniellales bacterium]
MLLGVIADDFTGASDIANTLAKGLSGQGGLRTAQFLGLPTEPAPPYVEAGVVALKSRSMAACEAVPMSLAALGWLKEQGCRQFVFKYGSTFDSTPEGNIGPVAEALAANLGEGGVVVCPAFPEAGRTLYQGHLFVHDRLLCESGMEHHPLNPMTESDIRRWLRRQCREPVGFIPRAVVQSGPDRLRAALAACAGNGETLVVVDAIDNGDLVSIGQASAKARLVTGGSGIALALPRNFIAAGLASGHSGSYHGVSGAEAILAGSCSCATRHQIEIHAECHPVLAVDAERVLVGATGPYDLVGFLLEHEGRAPLVYSSADPERVANLQGRYGRERVAAALDDLFAVTARMLVADGLRRLVVAGGETSGAVLSALGLGALTIGPEIDPGVPTLFADGDRPLALALKSGNLGSPGFFRKAVDKLGEGS